MHEYYNEDVAFERLKDLQREMENSRLAAQSLSSFGTLVRNLPVRAWWLCRALLRRPLRLATPGQEVCDETAKTNAA
jgi:hypothetical protein